MTEPAAHPKAIGLWPIPEQMVTYLKSWENYVNELEKTLARESATYQKEIAALLDEVSQAQHQLVNVEKPLRQQILNLQAKAAQDQNQIVSLREELDAAVTRLAQGLEISGVTKSTSLITMINDALILIEEAKKQLRESL